MADLLPCLEIGASLDEAEMSVILMHGLGASYHDFADVAQMFVQSSAPAKWRFVLPNAPQIPVTCNGGMVMPAWYDILDMSHPREVDWATVNSSYETIVTLLQREKAAKVFLSGFSQGGAMALHTGLRLQDKIAGIFSMSGYLLESDDNPCPDKETDIPIGLFHGDSDDVVPLQAAEHSFESLQGKGFDPTIKKYPGMGHSVSLEEIQEVFGWLKQRV